MYGVLCMRCCAAQAGSGGFGGFSGAQAQAQAQSQTGGECPLMSVCQCWRLSLGARCPCQAAEPKLCCMLHSFGISQQPAVPKALQSLGRTVTDPGCCPPTVCRRQLSGWSISRKWTSLWWLGPKQVGPCVFVALCGMQHARWKHALDKQANELRTILRRIHGCALQLHAPAVCANGCNTRVRLCQSQ